MTHLPFEETCINVYSIIWEVFIPERCCVCAQLVLLHYWTGLQRLQIRPKGGVKSEYRLKSFRVGSGLILALLLWQEGNPHNYCVLTCWRSTAYYLLLAAVLRSWSRLAWSPDIVKDIKEVCKVVKSNILKHFCSPRQHLMDQLAVGGSWRSCL